MSAIYTNPYIILRAAKEFYTSAHLLSETSTNLMCSDNETENHLSTSALTSSIVLYALSIEIGLKALIRLEGNTPNKNHNIKQLYGKLSAVLKDKIKDELPEDRFKKDIDLYLERNKNDFIDWRYYYEKSTAASSDFLAAFSNAIITVGNNI